MSYCLNSRCPSPQNPAGTNFCRTCGSKLLLKERYRTIKPLGQGGFGKTFLAVDEDKPSQPHCVIKQFFPQAQGTNTVQKAAELFTQEAVRLDELGKHSQIPELLAYFSQDSQQYLVQEFIAGLDLAHELAINGVFNEARVRSLLLDLLPVLQFVHHHQVIHRDIKPENIILRASISPQPFPTSASTGGGGQLVIVDFGAAKVATGTALGRTGTAIGSAGYSAPEQSFGRAVFGSDIYGLGVTCINLLTNQHPFDLFDPNENAWVWRKALKSSVSDTLSRILDKMVESAINRRYQSAAEILQELNPPTPLALPIPPQVIATPVKPQPQVTKSNSLIDAELAELKSQFLGISTPKPSPQATPGKVSPPTVQKSASQIDVELEEMRSQFLTNYPKQPPT